MTPIDSINFNNSYRQLANMEWQLYPATFGANPNCPSFINGYNAQSNNFGNFWGNNWNYPTFKANNNIWANQAPDTFTSSNKVNSSESKVKFGASQNDLDILSKYYVKGMAPSESLTSAAVGGAAFGLITNTRLLAHPINSVSSLGEVEKVFADVKNKGSKLHKLWHNDKTHNLVTDAYARMHKLEGGAKSKNIFGAKKGIFKAQIDETTYKALKDELTEALKHANPNNKKSLERLAKATERIRKVTDTKTGWLPNAWRRLWNNEAKTASSVFAGLEEKTIAEAATKSVTDKAAKTTIGQHLKHGIKGQAGLGGVLFAAMEFAFDFENIKSAFEKDNSTGMKQLGQTAVKAAGSIVGWTAGEAIGAWAGAKAGAALGTMIAPGVGTAIGAVAGLVGGSIGCALMGKLTHWLTGDSVGAKAKVEKMAKTEIGQKELLSLTLQQANGDKNLDPKVAKALQNVAAVYAA